MNFQLISFQQLKTSLQAMKNYILGVLPTKVSDLINDSEFTDKDYVDTELAKKQDTLPFSTPPAASDIGKALMPSAISNGEVTEWEFGEAGLIDDVQVNGTSIVNNRVANIPYANTNAPGVIKVGGGLAMVDNELLSVSPANSSDIKGGSVVRAPLSPVRQHESVFYGLAKAAGDATQASSDNAVGTYTAEAKTAIQSMIGVPSVDSVVDDVQVNGTSVVSNGVANIPIADTQNYGVIKIGNTYTGLQKDSSGYLKIDSASSSQVKAGADFYRPIVPSTQHEATFYGLAKVAGDTTQSQSFNAVGTYTDEAKGAIQHMIGADNLAPYESDITADQAYAIGELFMLNGKLHRATAAISELDVFTVGTNCEVVNASDVFTRDVQINNASIVSDGVANIPYASSLTGGVVKVGVGLTIENSGALKTNNAGEGTIKDGATNYQLITPGRQHISTFYGLAKAAGDTTQSSSNNAVGTYTEEAKTAIKAMLGVADGAMSVGTVTTLAPGSDATASITGDYDAMVLNLGIPEGDKGDKGDPYTLTTADKEEIKQMVLDDLPVSYPTAIVVTTPPTKTEYEIGNSFDKSGMVVTLIWSTGETKVLSDDEYGCSPALFNAIGTQNVTITYTGTEPYVLTTTQEVTVVNIIPDTWEKMVQVSKAGVAQDFFNVGDVINDTYTIGTTEYTNPWIVVDFQNVELQDGTTYDNVPILVMEYLNHENVMFDAPEQIEATEETASAGHYYYGYVAEGTVYTALNLNVGDLIPYSDYDKVFVTLWNSVNAIRYGTNCWALSYARQYLNNSGMSWWQAAHECDVMPNGYESKLGFKSYISPEMAAALHPIKITTKRSNYMGGAVDTTYDTFWLPSLNEMNIYNNSWIATVDGSPWQYYKELLESEEKVPNGTYEVLKKYSVNATTTAQHYWVRSAGLAYGNECYVYSSGNVSYSYPSNQYRLSPACAVI